MKFGVQKGITDTIWVGNINKSGNMFLNKEDKTVEVLSVVIELIKENNNKDLRTGLRKDGKKYYISMVEETV